MAFNREDAGLKGFNKTRINSAAVARCRINARLDKIEAVINAIDTCLV